MLITEVINTKLDEYFSMPYDMFGWIAPGGKLILATAKQAKSDEQYLHSDLASDFVGRPSYTAAYDAGYIRWFLQNGRLDMYTPNPVTQDLIDTIDTGIAAIEKVAGDPSKFNHFNGDQAKKGERMYIIKYRLDARDFWANKESRYALITAMKGKLENQ